MMYFELEYINIYEQSSVGTMQMGIGGGVGVPLGANLWRLLLPDWIRSIHRWNFFIRSAYNLSTAKSAKKLVPDSIRSEHSIRSAYTVQLQKFEIRHKKSRISISLICPVTKNVNAFIIEKASFYMYYKCQQHNVGSKGYL